MYMCISPFSQSLGECLQPNSGALGRGHQARDGAKAPLFATWATVSRSVGPSKRRAASPWMFAH